MGGDTTRPSSQRIACEPASCFRRRFGIAETRTGGILALQGGEDVKNTPIYLDTQCRRQLAGIELDCDIDSIRCAECGARLSEGSPITVAAERDGAAWRVTHVWSARCGPHTLEGFGAADAIVEADLGATLDTANQEWSPALLSVVVVDVDERLDPAVVEGDS